MKAGPSKGLGGLLKEEDSREGMKVSERMIPGEVWRQESGPHVSTHWWSVRVLFFFQKEGKTDRKM